MIQKGVRIVVTKKRMNVDRSETTDSSHPEIVIKPGKCPALLIPSPGVLNQLAPCAVEPTGT